MILCKVSGCELTKDIGDVCRTHYLRMYRHGTFECDRPRGLPLEQRIMRKVIKTKTGCWLFSGQLCKKGYGHIRVDDKRMRRTHVVMYEMQRGSVPPGLELDHKCRQRCCCNPDHLEAVTHIVNVRRAVEAGTMKGWGRLGKKERVELARRAVQSRWAKDRQDKWWIEK